VWLQVGVHSARANALVAALLQAHALPLGLLYSCVDR
jgi:hypothetical protein